MFANFFVLTRTTKKVYSTLRKSIASLRELFYMTTALFSVPAQKRTHSPRIGTSRTAAPRIPERLELKLDFDKTSQLSTSLPSKTRQAHPHMLFSPMHYERNYAYPLLIWLHGTGGDERQLVRIMPEISMQNYVAVAPRGLLKEQPACPPTFDLSVSAILQRSKERYDWILTEDNLTTIEQRVFDCITIAQERCNIAKHRIFIAGFGSGGTAALQLAMLYPERFAGAAAFGGDIPTASPVFPSWQMTQPLSILLGTDESMPDHACRMMELFYTAGLTVDVREYDNTGQLTPAMLQELNRWMMQIVCQSVTPALSPLTL